MPHILLIEPDAMLAGTFIRAFRHEGHESTWVSTAQAGIHAVDTRRPDIIILELQLPEHNGIEFLCEFRSYPEWTIVPVVINSHIPPTELIAVQHVLEQNLGVSAIHYKPHTTLQLLLRSISENLHQTA